MATGRPLGLLLPQLEDRLVYLPASRVTGECPAEVLETCWQPVKGGLPPIKSLLLNRDNGPQKHTRGRPQKHTGGRPFL